MDLENRKQDKNWKKINENNHEKKKIFSQNE